MQAEGNMNEEDLRYWQKRLQTIKSVHVGSSHGWRNAYAGRNMELIKPSQAIIHIAAIANHFPPALKAYR
jgi:hypothetical protein